jgi:hypothetical protein
MDQVFAFEKNSLDPLEIEILTHTQISGLLPMTASGEGMIDMVFRCETQDVTLDYLLKQDAFKKNEMRQLIQDLTLAKQQSEQRLLRENAILFDPQFIFYRPQKNTFMFIYLPVRSISDSWTCLQLMRHLCIESETLFTEGVLPILQSETFDLQHLRFYFEQDDFVHHQRLFKRMFFNLFRNRQSIHGVFKSRGKPVTHNNNEIVVSKPHLEKTVLSQQYAHLIDRSHMEAPYPIFFDYCVIGRDSGCNILLSDDSVSRRHAAIFKKGTAYFVEDLASKNGVFLNGIQIDKPLALSSGDTLRLGEKELVFVR